MSLALEAILRLYASVARTEIRKYHLASSCIASTWITIEVMKRLGFRAHPIGVRLTIGNESFRRLARLHGRLPKSKFELQAWTDHYGAFSIGIGFDPPTETTIGGHIVAVVEDKYLVDASFDQLQSPENGIRLPGVLVALVSDEFVGGTKRSENLAVDKLFVQYSLFDVLSPWKESCDWRPTDENTSAASNILAFLLKESGIVLS